MGVVFELRPKYMYIISMDVPCTPPAAPPLTVDNVLKVIKGVDWRSIGKCLCSIFTNLDIVVKGCVSDEARLEAVVKLGLHVELTGYKPSWRKVIWSLYEANQIHLADPQIRSYAEPLEGVLWYSHKYVIRSY